MVFKRRPRLDHIHVFGTYPVRAYEKEEAQRAVRLGVKWFLLVCTRITCRKYSLMRTTSQSFDSRSVTFDEQLVSTEQNNIEKHRYRNYWWWSDCGGNDTEYLRYRRASTRRSVTYISNLSIEWVDTSEARLTNQLSFNSSVQHTRTRRIWRVGGGGDSIEVGVTRWEQEITSRRRGRIKLDDKEVCMNISTVVPSKKQWVAMLIKNRDQFLWARNIEMKSI